MINIKQLLENNKGWSQRAIDANPRFFSDLADQQKPEYLWIGCYDSRVSANVIVGLDPSQTTIVLDAWDRGQELSIHGWIYGLKDGIIRDLEISISGEDDLKNLRNKLLFHDERREAGAASK